MLLLERITAVPALVPPPDVFTNVNRDMSKFEYQLWPWSLPLFGATHGDASTATRAFGRVGRTAATSSPMYWPACAAVHGWVWFVIVYWYQSGSISKRIG